jgi:hypothetical protein
MSPLERKFKQRHEVQKPKFMLGVATKDETTEVAGVACTIHIP